MKQHFWKIKIKVSTACGIKCVISIWHAYSSIIVNWSSHKSNLANPMTYKFWGNVGQNTLKKLPKFDGHGSSLLHATPIVPIHFTHPVFKWSTPILLLFLAVDDFDLPLFCSFFVETGVNSTLTKIDLEHLQNTKG